MWGARSFKVVYVGPTCMLSNAKRYSMASMNCPHTIIKDISNLSDSILSSQGLLIRPTYVSTHIISTYRHVYLSVAVTTNHITQIALLTWANVGKERQP